MTTPAASTSQQHESGSAMRSIGQLMAHQLLTRCATFTLNIMVARHIGPVSYGLSAVQLYLLNTIILFLSREAIRRSTLRYAAPASLSGRAAALYERTVLFNLSWLSVIASIPLCVLVHALFIASAPSFATAATSIDHGEAAKASVIAAQFASEYARCITLYTLASWIELLSEPLYVLGQKQQRVRARVVIDGAAVLARCVVTFISLMAATSSGGGDGGGLLAFASGQLAYALVIVAGYYSQCVVAMLGKSKVEENHGEALVTRFEDMMPRRLPTLPASSSTAFSSASAPFLSSFIDPSLLHLTREVSLQSLEKLCLQEGEKFVLVSLSPGGAGDLDAQGVYGLVQNLGSLVARMALQPLEEAAFMEFSLNFAKVTSEREKKEMASSNTDSSISASGDANSKGIKKGEDEEASSSSTIDGSHTHPHGSSYTSGVHMLGVLLHLVTLVGLLLLCFGPGYSYVFLDVVYGSRWSATSAPGMLSLYCGYILFMALNGVTEAFVSAVISTRQLRHYNICLVAFSVIYIAACAGMLRLGAGSSGLILANCINMAMRIAYSTWFIRRFFAEPSTLAATTTSTSTSTTTTAASTTDTQLPPPSNLVRQLWIRVVPDVHTCLAFLVSLGVTQLSFRAWGVAGSHSLARFAGHVAVGVACLALVAATIWKRERQFLQQIKGLAANRRRKTA